MAKRKYEKKTTTLKNDGIKRLEKETNIKIADTFIAGWSWEKMQYIFREVWWDILKYAKDNDLELRNIVAITGKDTRKTTVGIIFLWFLMTEYPYLNGFLLRDTILKAQSQMKQQLRKTVGLISTEYEVSGFQDKVKEANDGFYLVRDIKSKGNQKIELLSFNSIVELGGFTTNNGQPAIFIYDELQNPNSSHKEIINQKQFLANYKFIEEKNRAIELSTNNILPKGIPRHIFLSNRYVGNHPLNSFSEEHFPFYSHQEGDKLVSGVKDGMLEDPLNNNFIAKYFGKEDMKDGGEDFWGTMIIYASKLSNEILRKSKKGEQEQIELIKRGNEDDLARVIGDLFEGYDNEDFAYHYTRKDKITLDEFKKHYAKYVDVVRISMDVDYSRQIVMRATYDASKEIFSQENGNIKVWRVIRDKFAKIKCEGKLSTDGGKTEFYIKRIYNELLDYCIRINDMIPHIKKIKIIMDDSKAQLPGRFNFAEYKNNYGNALKVSFDKNGPIGKRPGVIDDMQDSGFVIDIEHPSLYELHSAYKVARIDKTKTKNKHKQRLEKDNDSTIDLMNTDEYGLYEAIPKMVQNNISTRLLGGKNEG